MIEAGDLMGHYGLGYTLLELGDLHGAYKHLRVYTEIARYSPWAWNYRGRAAEAMGEMTEARDCYRRAIGLERLLQASRPTPTNGSPSCGRAVVAVRFSDARPTERA